MTNQKLGVNARQTRKKSIAVFAVEEHGQGMGRARLARVRDASAASLIPICFIKEVVEPGERVHTDGWRGYWPLAKTNYTQVQTKLSASGDPAPRR